MTIIHEPICDEPASAEADLVVLHRYIETRDPDAFALIVERYGQVVYSASLRILGDEARAQDVSQETFFRLMRQPEQVTISLAGWLHRSATYLALDVRRSEIARRNRERVYGEQHIDESSPDLTWAEVSPLVDEALNELEDSTRMLLVRHFLQGTPQADLAAELNASPATVSRRIKAGLAALQTQLKKNGVQLGVSSLILFLLKGATRSASAAFVAEMGKMQLIASFRTMPITPPPVPFVGPNRYQMHGGRRPITSAENVLAYYSAIVLVTAFVFAIYGSWFRANHSAVQPSQQVSLNHAE